MRIELTEAPMTAFAEYARIPIAFKVACVLDVTVRVDGPGRFLLSERRLDIPYVKDYDADLDLGAPEPARSSCGMGIK
jgi:hypothetical protein